MGTGHLHMPVVPCLAWPSRPNYRRVKKTGERSEHTWFEPRLAVPDSDIFRGPGFEMLLRFSISERVPLGPGISEARM